MNRQGSAYFTTLPTRSPEIAPSSFAGVGAGDGAMAEEHAARFKNAVRRLNRPETVARQDASNKQRVQTKYFLFETFSAVAVVFFRILCRLI